VLERGQTLGLAPLGLVLELVLYRLLLEVVDGHALQGVVVALRHHLSPRVMRVMMTTTKRWIRCWSHYGILGLHRYEVIG